VPPKRNALNPAMIGRHRDVLSAVHPEGTRAIVLHADGNHFCAGLDLSTISGTTPCGRHTSFTLRGTVAFRAD